MKKNVCALVLSLLAFGVLAAPQEAHAQKEEKVDLFRLPPPELDGGMPVLKKQSQDTSKKAEEVKPKSEEADPDKAELERKWKKTKPLVPACLVLGGICAFVVWCFSQQTKPGPRLVLQGPPQAAPPNPLAVGLAVAVLVAALLFFLSK